MLNAVLMVVVLGTAATALAVDVAALIGLAAAAIWRAPH
jgi:hypothetical protein